VNWQLDDNLAATEVRLSDEEQRGSTSVHCRLNIRAGCSSARLADRMPTERERDVE
jgi:hypothetical protein